MLAVDSDASREITRELAPGERLAWAGMPCQGLRFRPADLLLVPFSLMWGGFACVWQYMAFTSAKAPLIMKLWGVPFVLFGLYVTVGRFFGDSFIRSRSYYGVTDTRAVIVAKTYRRSVQSIPLARTHITMDEHVDGRGSISFGSNVMPFVSTFVGTGWPGSGRYAAPRFDTIERVREVYELVRRNSG